MNVLSLQSSVASGHVGNSVAVFALQRLGHTVWPIDTVRFSNHPGRGAVRGGAAPWQAMAELLAGLAGLGLMDRCAAVLSGYLGAAEQGAVVLDAVAQAQRSNSQAIWLLDPVIGDRGKIFVREGVAEFIRDVAAPRADLLTPNQFELAYLTGKAVGTLAEALAAAHHLQASGDNPRRRTVVATGLVLSDAPADRLTILAVSAEAAWRAVAPLIEHPAYGAGDAFAALLLGWLLRCRDLAGALARALGALHGIIARTAEAGAIDLLLVEAQDEITAPSRLFSPERIA